MGSEYGVVAESRRRLYTRIAYVALVAICVALPFALFVMVTREKAESEYEAARAFSISQWARSHGPELAFAQSIVRYYTSPSAARADARVCSSEPVGSRCFAARVGEYADIHRQTVAPIVDKMRVGETEDVPDTLYSCIDGAALRGSLILTDKCAAALVANSYTVAWQR